MTKEESDAEIKKAVEMADRVESAHSYAVQKVVENIEAGRAMQWGPEEFQKEAAYRWAVIAESLKPFRIGPIPVCKFREPRG